MGTTRHTSRVKSEQPLGNDARKLRSQIHRQDEIVERASMAAAEARDDLDRLHRKLEKRFRRSIPQDALLLDVLQLIDIQPGARWIWRGVRNNYGLATVRIAQSEQSLVRYLAVMFGVIAEDQHGMLYPRKGDVEDVNPWHRVLRAADSSVGNPHRFTYA